MQSTIGPLISEANVADRSRSLDAREVIITCSSDAGTPVLARSADVNAFAANLDVSSYSMLVSTTWANSSGRWTELSCPGLPRSPAAKAAASTP